MRITRALGITALASLALAVGFPSWARPAATVSLEAGVSFHGELAPYGEWVEAEDYGRAWVPHVRHGWRPYTVGHWAWTEDYGWLWVSDEPFGWAVFHYGRWHPSPRYGWVWIPGYDWAPAWVAFRLGDGYAGWAPLPPSVEWETGVGFRVGAVEFDRYVDPRAYCFVPDRAFLDPVQHHVLPVERNPAIIRATRNVTDYRAAGDRVVNRGIAVDRVQELTRRAVPRARVVDVDSSTAARHARAGRTEVPVFRPSVHASREGAAARGGAAPRESERRQAETRRDVAQQRAAAQQREHDRREAEKRLARDHRQQEEERRQLERRQQRERADLERQHDREVKHPPRDAALEDLKRRQEEQHRAMEERQNRERQAAERRREMARQEEQRQQAAQRREARAPRQPEKNPPKPKDKPANKG